MTQKEDLKVADCSIVASQVVMGDSFMIFLSYLDRLVYVFYLIWNSSSSRVWL